MKPNVSAVNERILKIAVAILCVGLCEAPGAHGQARPSSPLLSEAREQGRQFWLKWFTVCGESYFQGAPGDLRELRGISFNIEAYPLSTADQLNGIQWKGNAMFAVKAFRDQHSGVWGPWEDGPRDGPTEKSIGDKGFGLVEMIKRNGQWEFSRSIPDRPASCAVVSGEKK